LRAVVWIPLLPAVSALVLLLAGRRLPRAWAGLQASGAVLGSFLIGAATLVRGLQAGPTADGRVETVFGWIRAGAFDVSVALKIDGLSLLMILVVTGVGFLIHVYSAGYMAEDAGLARYFGLLNLFVFFMLVLVMASDLVLMFVGWEGVGLCSYLLIGFWFDRDAAARAGHKAFLVNRVGDAGFIIGILCLLAAAGTTEIDAVAKAVSGGALGPGTAALCGILLFVGATGKSAQIPLYIWLPDAMEGPTPVSALIHAATMVTAGVYLVARLHVLYSFSATASLVVALVGALTAVYAASLALVETNIKRVLAYSTISQIGYMFIGCGVGAYASGLFHLVTHAFFKSLLFLGAGSVMHALAGEVDIRRMGGLRRLLPLTHPVFLAGTLAIAGVPFLSGFFSKDAILASAYASGRYGIWALGLIAACLTAFYMFRLLFLVFYGDRRAGDATVHESSVVMIAPMSVLAVLSLAAGGIGLPALFGRDASIIGRLLAPVFPSVATHSTTGGTEALLMLGSVLAASLGFAVAYLFYIRSRGLPDAWARRLPGAYRVLAARYYVDEAVDAALLRPLVRGSEAVYRSFDLKVIDRAANGAASATGILGRAVARAQTGFLRDAALIILAGAVATLAFVSLQP
jgi:NADH-quinone oxidoreductase subunit L